MDAVPLAEQKLDAAADIFQGDAALLPVRLLHDRADGYAGQALVERNELLCRDACAVVADVDVQVLVRLLDAYGQKTVVLAALEAVEDGIFDDGLQEKLRALHAEDLVAVVAEAVLLDHEVVVDIFELLADRHEIPGLRDRVAEKGGQRLRDIGDRLRPGRQRVAADGVQRIVEEMRVDLILQREKFRLLGRQLHDVLAVDQGVQPVDILLEIRKEPVNAADIILVDLPVAKAPGEMAVAAAFGQGFHKV